MTDGKDIRATQYAEWLEDVLKKVMENQPESIGVCMLLRDGTALTGYYGCGNQDKALMAYHMGVDAVFDVVKANAGEIVAAAQDAEDGEEDNGGGTAL